MKQIWTILLMLALAQASFGQLSGALSGTLGPGAYHVVGIIHVDFGDSLRVMPGTTFVFDGPYPFRIYGTLLAEGTESNSIVLQPQVRVIGKVCASRLPAVPEAGLPIA